MFHPSFSTPVFVLSYLLLIVMTSTLRAQTENNSHIYNSNKGGLQAEHWLEDLNFMVDKLRNDHYRPFTNFTEESFDSAVYELRTLIPESDDNRIIAKFSELVASFGWGHTRINLPINYEHLGFYQGHRLDDPVNPAITPFSVLPVRFIQCHDGVFIQSAVEDYRNLLGKQLKKIGTVPINEALKRITKYISYENESALKLQAPVYLCISELLHLAGINETIDKVSIEIADGSVLILSTLSYEEKPIFIDVISAQNIDKPLWLQDTKSSIWQIASPEEFWTTRDQYYRYVELPMHKALYIKLNYIAEHPEMSLAGFMNEAIGVAENNAVEKIILDLRHNTGGVGDSNRAIRLALQRWSRISNFGSLFVIVGRQTYSAAILLAQDLEKNMNALFLGEEIGGKPAHIGDSKRLILPNSGLTLRVSVAEHKDWTGLPDRSSIWLHYPTPFKFDDYKNGIDTSLDFVLNYKISDVKDEIVSIYQNTNINIAILILYKLYTDPREVGADHAGIAYTLASYILEKEQNLSYAKYITDVSLEYNANDLSLLFLKVELAMKEENNKSAENTLMQILKLDPENQRAKKLLVLLKN